MYTLIVMYCRGNTFVSHVGTLAECQWFAPKLDAACIGWKICK